MSTRQQPPEAPEPLGTKRDAGHDGAAGPANVPRRPEKMLEWLSLQWSAIDAAFGGLMLLRPRRELVQAWLMMSAASAFALGMILFAEPLLATLPEAYREATWFTLIVVPAAAALIAVPPFALAALWLTGRALARERKAERSPLAGRLFPALGGTFVLTLPTAMGAAILAHGCVYGAILLSAGSAVPGLVQSLGWAAALGVVAGWALPRILYVPSRLADGVDASLGASRAKVRALSRLAYGRGVLVTLLFLLLLSIIYVVAHTFYVSAPEYFSSPAGRLVLTLLASLPAGFFLAHATTTATWMYTRLTLRDTISDKGVAAMTTATASLAGLGANADEKTKHTPRKSK